MEWFDERRVAFEDAGFVWCGSPFPGHRLVYNMHESPRGGVRCHVHVSTTPRSENNDRVLLFRDALRAVNSLRDAYALLKLKLADDGPDEDSAANRARYSRGKSAFVRSVAQLQQEATILEQSVRPRPCLDSTIIVCFGLFAFVAMVFEPLYYFPCEFRLDALSRCGDAEHDGIVLQLWRLYARWDALFVVVPDWLRITNLIQYNDSTKMMYVD